MIAKILTGFFQLVSKIRVQKMLQWLLELRRKGHNSKILSLTGKKKAKQHSSRERLETYKRCCKGRLMSRNNEPVLSC